MRHGITVPARKAKEPATLYGWRASSSRPGVALVLRPSLGRGLGLRAKHACFYTAANGSTHPSEAV